MKYGITEFHNMQWVQVFPESKHVCKGYEYPCYSKTHRQSDTGTYTCTDEHTNFKINKSVICHKIRPYSSPQVKLAYSKKAIV